MVYFVQRWTGKGWNTSMCSPYNSKQEALKHIKQYWWHYTDSNPYRIIEQ